MKIRVKEKIISSNHRMPSDSGALRLHTGFVRRTGVRRGDR